MQESKVSTIPPKHKVDYEKFYNTKGWCDALDSNGVWRLGRIKRIAEDYVLVLFDGWSEKWNQWYCKHSPSLAPIRTYTCGYTGQMSVTLRDFEIDQNFIQAIERKLMLLINDSKLQSFDAFKLASFIRGDLFVLADSILTLNDRIEAGVCHHISKFLQQYVELSLQWMNNAIQTYQTMRKEIGVDNTNYLEEIQARKLHVTSKSSSLYLCGFEIFLTLKSIFGFERRCTAFYEKNNLPVNPKGLILNFLNKQGLNKLNDLLSYQDKQIPNGKIDLALLLPLVYSIPLFFLMKSSPWITWQKPLERFISTLHLRFQKEFEADPQLKTRLEKDKEFLDFLKALERINMMIGQDNFQLKELFQQKEAEEELNFALSSEKQKPRGESDLFSNDEGLDWKKQYRDSVLVSTLEFVPKNTGTSQEILEPKQEVGTKEVDDLKQQLANLQNQMANIHKTMSEVSQGQANLKSVINKRIDDQIAETSNKMSKTKQSAVAVSDEYLESLKKSGLTPKELGNNLEYVKGVYKVLKVEEKSSEQPVLEKAKLNVEKYNDWSFGNSEDELKVLTALEFYLMNNRLVEAMKLIKWRKKIVKLAQMNGWDVASIIAKRTFSKLDVDASDIIMSNLCLMQKVENVIGFTRGYDSEMEIDEEENEEVEEGSSTQLVQ